MLGCPSFHNIEYNIAQTLVKLFQVDLKLRLIKLPPLGISLPCLHLRLHLHLHLKRYKSLNMSENT